MRQLEREPSSLKAKIAASQDDELVNQAVDINGTKLLAVWSRDEVTGVSREYSRSFLPSFNNGLVGRFPSQAFQMLGKVEGANESEDKSFSGAFLRKRTGTKTKSV